MLKQYSILSRCLAELKKSDLPIIEKLRIEVQLIQTKRILLDHRVEHKIAGVAGSELQFNNLFEQLRFVCNSGNIADIDRLKELIQLIKEGVNQETEGRNLYALSPNDKKNQGAALRLSLHGLKDITY